MFDRNSRYASLPIATYEQENGTTVLYVRRRMVPPLRANGTRPMTVVAGQRLDTITGSVIGDPTLFWRITDVNDELNPFDLVDRPGTQIRIPVSAVSN